MVIHFTAPKLSPEITKINWSTMTAECIRRRYRALYGFKQLATHFNGFEVRLMDILLENKPELVPSGIQPCGTIEFMRASNLLKVHCANGSRLQIRSIAVKGKKSLTAADFRNGYLKKVSEADRYFR